MKTAVDKINDKIKALYEKRNKAGAITADGVPIEVGMTLYAWDLGGLEVYEISETAKFQEHRIWQTEPQICMEDYCDLFADAEKATENRLKRAKEDVIRAERNYIYAQERLTNLEEQIKKDLGEEDEASNTN
jgi:hypothetical protein